VRIVIDTNVLIAALISQGLCHELMEHCVLNHDLVSSNFILDELHEKLTVKFGYTDAVAREAADLFRAEMEIVDPTPLSDRVSRDRDDDNILAAAVAGNCDCIITGDKDLLVLGFFRDIKILSPREFSDQEV
jgi:putative PIN family toxin of toxin-antitoxin system